MRRVLVALALLGMLVLSGLQLAPIYNGTLLPLLVTIAAAASVLISVAVRRLPAYTAAPASVLGLAAMVFATVRVSAQAGQVAGPVPDVAREALANSIPRLLTALIPIEPQPDTVLLPVIATWLAGLAAAEAGVRYRRVLLSYSAPTVLFGGALYLVGPDTTAARTTTWIPLAYAALAILGLIASARPDLGGEALTGAQRRTLGLRLGGGALAGLAVIVLLSQLLGPTVAEQGNDTPVDPRNYVTPPQLDALDENPLVRLSGWNLNKDQHLFDAVVAPGPGAQQEPLIRLAILNDYDGVTWRIGSVYRNAGRVLGRSDGDGPAVTQTITIDELDGRLLPGIATPERVEGVRVAYDADTGTIALTDPVRKGLRYTVTSRQKPRPDDQELFVAEVPSPEEAGRFLALPGKVPDSIAQLGSHLGEGVSNPYQRAFAIQQWLEEHYKLVADAPSGHSYPNVEHFLFGNKQLGGQKGTSEQFTAAFAVLARLAGLPTRVAVGFQTHMGSPTIRGADAIAWPEVEFKGFGWVAFDPLPKSDTVQRPVEDDFKPKAPPSNPPPPSVPPPSDATSVQASRSAGPSAAPAVTSGGGNVLVLVVAAGVPVLLLTYFVAVPLLVARRRRQRLSTGPPSVRIDAAWNEVLIGLRQAGRPAPAHLTAEEIARYAANAAEPRAHSAGRSLRPAVPPVDELAVLVNAVAFAGASGPGESQAVRATAQATAYVEDLRGRRPWWRRLVWTLDPRPLRWHRRR
ncbi:hypothetical protein GCM10018962_87500 [Dactylosporangium matsuzakiense]|uniref:Transglutaminase-like domain-containing protein n=1 Tax=Dactylosporangium matsuzakiense TaxID=53360 RepID=A0A9W6KKD3_9ACTN|nr:transglutaminase domain-containing protein [Dactylosporangium matsuzakiense]GLL01760.1 hypothetical protein GCM10017581_035020 [Dactylosporangium matsuzakiense]